MFPGLLLTGPLELKEEAPELNKACSEYSPACVDQPGAEVPSSESCLRPGCARELARGGRQASQLAPGAGTDALTRACLCLHPLSASLAAGSACPCGMRADTDIWKIPLVGFQA